MINIYWSIVNVMKALMGSKLQWAIPFNDHTGGWIISSPDTLNKILGYYEHQS